jgi:toxin FitB
MYLLDTVVVSAMRRPERNPARVDLWVAKTPLVSCFLSVMTLVEIEYGILRLARRDMRQASGLRRWFEETMRPSFAGRILPIDEPVAIACAGLHVPDPRPERDALIAATAIVHGLTMVTRKSRDFQGLPVALVNPWQPG